MLISRHLVRVDPGPVAVLEGLNLELRRGMFGLLGPNGAGKLSLMESDAGVLEPTAGEAIPLLPELAASSRESSVGFSCHAALVNVDPGRNDSLETKVKSAVLPVQGSRAYGGVKGIHRPELWA